MFFVPDPLSHVAFAVAAGNGTVDGVGAPALVAAGVSLLQRSAPIVRALHGHRSGVLLSPGAAWLCALAASEGRSAVMLHPELSQAEIARAVIEHDVGVVFTTEALARRIPARTAHVALDAIPRVATWCDRDDSTREISLAMHDGLTLEGDRDTEGSPEEVWRLVGVEGRQAAMTHRDVLGGARHFAQEARLSSRDHALVLDHGPSIEAMVLGVVAPLVSGARVSTAHDATHALATLEREGVSLMVAHVKGFEALLQALDVRGAPLDAPVLQRCVATGGTDADRQALAARWRDATGMPLLQRRPHAAGSPVPR